MKASVAVPITVIGAAVLAVMVTLALAVADLRGDATTRMLWTWAGRFWTGLCGLLPLLLAVALTVGMWNAAAWARNRAALIYHRRGLLPASANPSIKILASYRNEQAEVAQAVFDGHVDRANSGGIKALLNPRPDDALLPAPSPVSLGADDVFDSYDPQREPHWLLIGQTGSGKSHAVFGIARQIARRYNSKFLIAERGGIDWNTQADARTVEGYATLLDTVEQERQRRGELMRAADVDNITRLAERLPLLVVIIEEAESVYGRLFELDRTRARQFMATLRDLASQGRKQGVVLIVATQTGTSGVFDAPTRRNLGNTLIFRSEAIVGDQFGVPRDVRLQTLPSGTAYALKFASTVEFPFLDRPQLPHAPLYHEPDDPLLLAEDAEADGLGDDDMPDGPADGTRYTVQMPGGGIPRYTGIAYHVPGNPVPLIDYDEALHRRLWAALCSGSSLKGAQEKAGMGYTGGTGFYLARQVQELGNQRALPWEVV